MYWAQKRQTIRKNIYPQPTLNSSLKRKLTLIARIKDQSTGITSEIIAENLTRFTHEIVQTILLINLQKIDQVQSIVEVCHYFSATYSDFKEIFIAGVQNLIRDNMKDLDAMLVYFYYEIMRIGLCTFEIKSFAKMFLKMKDRQKYRLCEILSSVYEDEYKYAQDLEDYPLDDLKIANQTKSATLNFVTRIDNLSFEQISIVMKKLQEEKRFEKEYIEKNYHKVIDITPNEFKFYEKKIVPTPSEYTIDYFLSHMLWFINSPSEIDFIAQRYVHNYGTESENKPEIMNMKIENGKIITSALKYIENYDTLPVLARFLSWYKITTVIKFLEHDCRDQCLILLCELSKFDVYSKFKVIEKLEHAIKKKNIQTMILLLDNIGRYYLHHRETNFGMRKVFEKIKILRNENSDLTRIEINSAVGRILNKSEKNETLDDFFIYMITEERFNGSELNSLLKDEHLMLIFMKPWLFEDHAYIHSISVERKMESILGKLLRESIIISALSHKLQQALSYASLYSHFPSETKKVVDKIFSLKIKECEKALIIMNFLDIKKEKGDYVDEIKILVEMSDNIDVKNNFVHWLAKYNLKSKLIDLDKEIELLKLE